MLKLLVGDKARQDDRKYESKRDNCIMCLGWRPHSLFLEAFMFAPSVHHECLRRGFSTLSNNQTNYHTFFFLKKRLNLPLVKSQESKFCLININLFNKTIMFCLRFDQINNEYIYFDWKLAILAFQHIVEYSLFTYVATLSIFRWWIKEHCVKWSISSILFLNLTLL